LTITRDADGVSTAILAYARSIAPEAAVIIYVSMPNTKIEDGFAEGVDMIGADHHDVGAAITLLALELADNVERAQEDDT
jgi:hypothetical protein